MACLAMVSLQPGYQGSGHGMNDNEAAKPLLLLHGSWDVKVWLSRHFQLDISNTIDSTPFCRGS